MPTTRTERYENFIISPNKVQPGTNCVGGPCAWTPLQAVVDCWYKLCQKQAIATTMYRKMGVHLKDNKIFRSRIENTVHRMGDNRSGHRREVAL